MLIPGNIIMLVKNGRVEIGKTPSPETGKPCTKVHEGEPLEKGEKPKKRIEKIAKMLDPEELGKDQQE